MSKFLKASENLYFFNQVVKPESSEEKLVDVSAHHTFIIDCSGSMWGELSEIKRDLYNKISTMLKPNDSVTIIWFSGKDEYGVLLEDYHVNSTMKLNKVRDLIDRHLTPRGLTAFRQPIEEMGDVIDRVTQRNPEMLHTMFFLTDGYDNQSSTPEILNTIEGIKEKLSSATIIEYGWYCNKQLLNEMATTIGGVHTFSENFDDYEPYVEKALNNGHTAKRRYIKLDHVPHNGVVFNIVDGDIITYLPNDDNEIFVGVEGEIDLFYFTEETPTGDNLGGTEYISDSVIAGTTSDDIFSGLYGAAFAYSRKSDYNMVSEIIKFLGDAYLITEKANTFGTQKINELESKFVDAMNNESKRFIDGYNPDLEPAEDAFCVMDLLEVLMSDEENVWYPRDPSFSYKRTGGKSTKKNPELSDSDKDELKALTESGDIDGLHSKIKSIKESKVDAVEFNFNEENPASSFINLTWNNSRANLSVQVEYKGYVILPENDYNLPEKFDTKIYRNYTIIKDGIIHTYELPVSLTEETFNTLQANGLLEGETWEKGKIMTLDYSSIPVINREMVKTLSAESLFKKSYDLTKLQASNYVFGQYKKKYFDGASKGFKDLYGEEATNWLKELGLRDYGFNPPIKVEKMNEEIEVNTLSVKIKGLASKPTKKDFESAATKIEAGLEDSLSSKEALLAPSIKEFKSFENTLTSLDDETKLKVVEEWIYAKADVFRKTKSKLMSDISKAKFLTIVGKSWFQEFESREDRELTLELDGSSTVCSVEDKIETIKL